MNEDIVDSIWMGWYRSIRWLLSPLNMILYGKWHITISIPRFRIFIFRCKYMIKRTDYCFKCNVLVPVWQLGSVEGSSGLCCAQCI